MNRSRPTAAVLVACLALVLAACAGEATSPAAIETESLPTATILPTPDPTEEPEATQEPGAEEVSVQLASSSFDPPELTVEVGTTVLFRNTDRLAHTVTEGTDGRAVDGPIVDRELEQGRSVRVTFDEPGTYDVTCKFHPTMQMTITVEG